MPSLVPIPWQSHLLLTPSTLGYLIRASGVYGANLYVFSPDGAWRAYAQQLKYYQAWLAYKAGHGPYAPVASSPDVGQRNHMRAAAFDLVLTSTRAQNACRAVGLVRDSEESWHWNDPNWRNMPIIPTNTSAASGEATLISKRRMNDMPVFFCDIRKTPFLYALAGSSPGTTANWLETTNDKVASQWSGLCGGYRIDLVSEDFATYKAKYLEPVRTKS